MEYTGEFEVEEEEDRHRATVCLKNGKYLKKKGRVREGFRRAE